MKAPSHVALATLLLVACKSEPTITAGASNASTKAPSTPATSVASAGVAAPAPTAPSASSRASPATASASAPASAAGESPCPAGARRDDDAHYCITLPAKRLAISYEGDSPAKGIREELEIAGDRVVIEIGPAPAGQTVASMKASALKRIGASLVESGDLTNGYWTDLKQNDGKRIIEGVVVAKFVITCSYEVDDEKNVEAARAVCKSLKTF